MNTPREYKDDQMHRYLTPELIEKAPSGFSEKVMNMVSVEAFPVRINEKRSKRNLIPFISITVILVLALSALLIPAAGANLPVPAWLKVVKNIFIPHSNFDLDSLLNFNLPWYLPYLFLCILFLAFFDSGLNGLFHRWKSDESPDTDPGRNGV
jgi:hypothetical protein